MRITRLMSCFVIIAALVLGLLSAPTPAHAAVGIITVDTSSSAIAADGDCSLPEAMAVINGTTIADCPSSGSASIDTIKFNLNPLTDPNYNSGTGIFTITLTAGLSTTHPLALDGTSQSGYSSSPLIWLDETAAGNNLLQLDTGSDGSTVKGLILSNTVAKADLLITNGGSNTVQANYFDNDGTALQGSASTGVDVTGSTNNLIGGPNTVDRNLFAAAGQYGVYLHGTGSTGNLVQGNYFGLQSDGVTAITGQTYHAGTAIYLSSTPGGSFPNNTVRGNVITEFGFGIELTTDADHNKLVGNFVGVGIDGSTAPDAPYAFSGIYVLDASSNVIGGVTAADRNIISNYGAGVQVSQGTGVTSNNLVEGNYIGTDATGTSAKPNGYGVWVNGGDGTLIGGTATGAGNVISGNSTEGVMVTVGTNTRVLGNLVGTNKNGTAALANPDGIRAIGAPVMVGDSLTPGNNLISGNIEGILIQNTSGSTVFGNKFGMSLDGTTAIANTEGVYVGSTSAQIGNNWFANNFDGVYLNGTATAIGPSSGNCFKGNTHSGVDNSNTAATAPFTGNWWGTADGPSGAGSGTGDGVSTDVDFSSFLAAPSAACKLQLLANPGFDIDADHNKKPDSWTFVNFTAATDKRDCTVHQAGPCSLKLVGNGLTKTASQVILRSGGAGEIFTFALWSKASSVPIGGIYRVQVKFYNGTTLLKSITNNFGVGTHAFKKVSGSYTAPGPYTKVIFRITFKEASGAAWFDAANLNWAP